LIHRLVSLSKAQLYAEGSTPARIRWKLEGSPRCRKFDTPPYQAWYPWSRRNAAANHLLG